MNPIIVTTPGGQQRVITYDPEGTYHEARVQEIESLTLRFDLLKHEELPLGSWVTCGGHILTLMRSEDLTMHHTQHYTYTAVFKGAGERTKLYKVHNPVDGRLKFTMTAKPHEHLQMLVDLLNARDGAGWEIGGVPEGGEIMLAYDHIDIYNALLQLAEKLETEWTILDKRLIVGRIKGGEPIKLRYGNGNGIQPNVRRQPSDDYPVYRVYAQGSERNIDPSKYGSRTLRFERGASYEKGGKRFRTSPDGTYAEVVTDSTVGAKDESLDLTHVYPSRVGEVTQVITKKELVDFTDTSIPEELDYEKCLLPGQTMSVIFQTGMLAGRTLDVKYIHKAKRFELVPREEDGVTIPSGVYMPKAGDKYIVIHCALPEGYVRDAERRMTEEAVTYLLDRQRDGFGVKAELDGIWVEKNWAWLAPRLQVGAMVEFADKTWMPEPVDIRIVSMKTYLARPYSPVVELSNDPVSPSFSSVLRKIDAAPLLIDAQQNRRIKALESRTYRDAERTRKAIEQLKLEGFSQAIKPETVQTLQLIVGSPGLQFDFVASKTDLTPVPFRWERTASVLKIPAHFLRKQVAASALTPSEPRYEVYEIPPLEYGLKDEELLYLYAVLDGKANRFTLVEKPMTATREHNLVAILTGTGEERKLTTLYGFTEVLPGQIKTDLIRSQDGKSYWDLLTGRLHTKTDFIVGDPAGETCLAYLAGKLYVKGMTVTLGKDSKTIEEILAEGAKKADDANRKADELTKHPAIAKNGTWWVWRDGAYIDTGEPAVGADGKDGLPGSPGKDGTAQYTVAEIDARELDEDKYYPVVVRVWGEARIHIRVTSGLFTKKVTKWTTHNSGGFSLELQWSVMAGEWGVRYAERRIEECQVRWIKSGERAVGSIDQEWRLGREYFYVRGGAKYTVTTWRDGGLPGEPAKLYPEGYDESKSGVRFQLPLRDSVDPIETDREKLYARLNAADKSVADLRKYTDGAFKDGIVDAAEVRQIKSMIKEIESSWALAFGEYERTYTHPLLTGDAKQSLGQWKITLAGAKDDLVRKIGEVIADGKATDAERGQVDGCYDTYNTALLDFKRAIKTAEEVIRRGTAASDGRNLLHWMDPARTYGDATSPINTWERQPAGVYTVSFDVQIHKRPDDGYVRVCLFQTGRSDYQQGHAQLAEGKTRYAITVEVTGDFVVDNVRLYPQQWYLKQNDPKAGDITFSRVKMERGSVATPWTEAPEDVQRRMTDQMRQSLKDSEAKSQAAWEAYARLKAEAAATMAKAYADDQITKEERARIDAVGSALEAAQRYAQAQDELLRTRQNAYADGKVTEAERRAIAEAQRKVDEAERRLKSYTDAAVEAEKRLRIAEDDKLRQSLGTVKGLIDALEKNKLNADAMPDLSYLIDAFKDGGATITGLLFARVMALSDQVGQITAYLNGSPAGAGGAMLKAGVTGFGTTEETERARINHDGTGHLGDMYFQGRRIDFKKDGTPFLSVGGGLNDDTIEDVLSRNAVDRDLSLSGASFGMSSPDEWTTRSKSDSFYVENDESEVTISMELEVDMRDKSYIPPSRLAQGIDWSVGIVVKLDDTTLGACSMGYRYNPSSKTWAPFPENKRDTVRWSGKLKAGTHYLNYEFRGRGEELEARAAGVQGHIRFVTDFKQAFYSDKGMRLYAGSDKYFDVNYNASLFDYFVKIRGGLQVDYMNLTYGGFYAAGVINEWGQLDDNWIGQQLETKRIEDARYRIEHNIGHTRYSVQAMPVWTRDCNCFIYQDAYKDDYVDIGVMWNGGKRGVPIHFAIFTRK